MAAGMAQWACMSMTGTRSPASRTSRRACACGAAAGSPAQSTKARSLTALLQVRRKFGPGTEAFEVLRHRLQPSILVEGLEVGAEIGERLAPPHAPSQVLRREVGLGHPLPAQLDLHAEVVLVGARLIIGRAHADIVGEQDRRHGGVLGAELLE